MNKKQIFFSIMSASLLFLTTSCAWTEPDPDEKLMMEIKQRIDDTRKATRKAEQIRVHGSE